MRTLLLATLLCIAVLVWPAPLNAADQAQPAEAARQALRVAISEVPPFVIHEPDGSWRGISIDLWREVAKTLGYEFQLLPMPFKDVLPSLEAGKVDVVVGALTVTADREARVDFTHAFYQTGLAIAVRQQGADSVWTVLRSLFTWRFVSLVLGLAGLLFVAGALLWLFERHRNRQQFGGTTAEGLGHGFWWAAVTMTTVGYGDKSPVKVGGRLVAIVWMFAGLVMVSGFTAALTSALTIDSLQGEIAGPRDLQRVHVATVAGTASARFLDNERIRHSTFPDARSAMQAVQRGQTDAVVYDQPILQYRNAELSQGGLRLLPGTFENQAYAFAVANGNALREPIGQAILHIIEGGAWPELKRKYLGAAPQ